MRTAKRLIEHRDHMDDEPDEDRQHADDDEVARSFQVEQSEDEDVEGRSDQDDVAAGPRLEWLLGPR